jgi:hypothetical protein
MRNSSTHSTFDDILPGNFQRGKPFRKISVSEQFLAVSPHDLTEVTCNDEGKV